MKQTEPLIVSAAQDMELEKVTVKQYKVNVPVEKLEGTSARSALPLASYNGCGPNKPHNHVKR